MFHWSMCPSHKNLTSPTFLDWSWQNPLGPHAESTGINIVLSSKRNGNMLLHWNTKSGEVSYTQIEGLNVRSFQWWQRWKKLLFKCCVDQDQGVAPFTWKNNGSSHCQATSADLMSVNVDEGLHKEGPHLKSGHDIIEQHLQQWWPSWLSFLSFHCHASWVVVIHEISHVSQLTHATNPHLPPEDLPKKTIILSACAVNAKTISYKPAHFPHLSSLSGGDIWNFI